MDKENRTYYLIAFSAMLGYYIGKVADTTYKLVIKNPHPQGELGGYVIIVLILLFGISSLIYGKRKRPGKHKGKQTSFEELQGDWAEGWF